MSSTPIQEPPIQGLSSGSGQTLPSRPLQLSSDPSASKRVCFYKSGDYQFGGHRMVINARTFKTFDALLDVLSKKVPLAFGVRTITTPRGTHLVKALDDLHDGGAYVCSDQKRVKPLNLDEVNRRQVPWNTTRPLSAGRRRRVAVRTPKRLMVIKNRDPSVKRTIVLQRRTAPTFDALLDYLSQILQFPVLKLYSTDGRRVDGLAALILCSGVVVAAGNEPFRLANYSFHRTGSRNFSVSSERYIVNQINKSQNGHLHPHNGLFEAEANQHHTSMEMSGTGREDNVHQTCIVPHDDDIEKSFRVNQDGSMTVEMKVRLTIKEEEMVHWTTTLSRTSLSKRAACASISESGNRSPDSNNAIAKDSSSISEEETKEENFPSAAGKGVGFNDERTYEGYTSTATGKAKKSVKRTPTPGPRHVNKKASIESVKRVTESGVQESMLGHYSYVERTADGETTEGYCLVKRSSSSSNRPIPKPRKTASAGMSNKCTPSSIRSSGVAEVLQIQNNGMEFRETVMHIYETQGCYDNYFANQEYSVDGVPLHGSPPALQSKQSTDSGPHSSSNDCDIDCSWQPPTADSLQRQKEEMLSLSSEPVSLTHENTNNLSSPSENETQRNLQILERVKLDNTPKSTTKKKMTRSARSQKSSTSTSYTDRKPKESLISPSKDSKHSSADKISSKASVGKRSVNSSESPKSGQKSKGAEKKAESLQSKKSNKGEKTPTKSSASLVRTENLKRAPQRQNTGKAAASDIGHNVNTPTGRPQMKKNMSDILQPNKSLTKKTTSKPKSMPESGISPTKPLVSMPSLDPSPSEIHQYVENWLEKVTPDQVPYPEEVITEETQPRTKVIFQIGGDSESDEKNECQTNLDENNPSPNDVIKGSASCLSVPLSHQELTTVQGLSVSMPNVRADLEHQENRLRPHKSAEAICPAGDETSSSSNFLSPKAKIKPALQQLCSSIQCIRRASDTNVASNLEKSNSLPDFPTQVASVFGSSCKAFLSFLSVMTLRDHLIDSTPREDKISRTTSEAMLMMESLQKISAIEDEEEQRTSLTDLQSRASSRLRQSWKDFQILRERLESEPLSPKVSETEFALDVFSEGGDAFEEQHSGIDELMEELSMPQDLREQIASTIRTFYPVEESQCLETDRNQSDSEEDLEQFVQDCNDETKQSLESDSRCVTEDTTDAVYTQQGQIISKSEQPSETQESQTEKEELLKDKENETKEEESGKEGQLEEEKEVKIREDEDTKETEADCYRTEKEYREREEEEEEEQEAKSGEVSSEESIDKEEGGAYEEEETKEEESKKEEQLEEKREVKIKGDGDTEDESEGTEKEDGEREEDRAGEPEQSESDEESGEGSVDKEEAGVDEDEKGSDGEEVEKEEESREQEQLEEKREVKIKGGGDTEDESEGTEKEDGEREEDRAEEPEQSESDKESGEESVDKEEAGVDEDEQGTDEEETTEEVDEVNQQYRDRKDTEADSEGTEKEDGEREEDRAEEPEQSESDKESGEESIDKEEAGVDEDEQGTDEEETTEEVDEVNQQYRDRKDIEADSEGTEKENRGRGEDGEEEPEQSESEEVSDEQSLEKKGAGADEEEAEMTLDERELGDELGEGEKEEADEIDEAFMNEDPTQYSAEETDEREGAGETEEEEKINETVYEEGEEKSSDGGENDERHKEEKEDEGDNVEETNKGGEVENVTVELEQEEEENEELHLVTGDGEKELLEGTEVSDDEETKIGYGIEADEEEEVEAETNAVTATDPEERVSENADDDKEMEEFTEDRNELEVEDEKEIQQIEEVSEGNNEEEEEEVEEERGQDEEHEEEGSGDSVVKNTEEERERTTTDEEEVDEGRDTDTEDEKYDEAEDRRREPKQTESSQEEESAEERECGEELERDENLTADQTGDEEEMEDDEEKESQEKLDQEKKQGTESPSKYSSEGQCADDKGNGTDTVTETDEGGEMLKERSGSLSHPGEISQELLDFVNYALRSSSLVFIYDKDGNIRIEPDNAQVVKTKQSVLLKSRKDSSYGLKCLPSPNTSDLSDYRPETSESGGYKTQESVDIMSESGGEASEKPSPVYTHSAVQAERTNLASSKLSVASNSGTFPSSSDSGTKASREDLSYFSAASSLKADREATTQAAQCISFVSQNSADGVLIDQGRWLLKENHLIRKSPPVSLGMYGNLDSTSLDTGQENTSDDSPPHFKTQHSPLAAISSSELEEMAKPPTPKCIYYNLPHGSDSDPFLDDSSIKSSARGRGVRVSPTIDTSKTWANKNGSQSSFASVEFRIPDRKVHPEGESAVVTQPSRTSGGVSHVLQAQDSMDNLHLRCGQYFAMLYVQCICVLSLCLHVHTSTVDSALETEDYFWRFY
uniref:Doublecortin domain-containing protein n=1 Tax=Oreochromis aureus TaxID=47969 RepID=A0A668U7G0_OREAU